MLIGSSLMGRGTFTVKSFFAKVFMVFYPFLLYCLNGSLSKTFVLVSSTGKVSQVPWPMCHAERGKAWRPYDKRFQIKFLEMYFLFFSPFYGFHTEDNFIISIVKSMMLNC
jgi:hypothetical protein